VVGVTNEHYNEKKQQRRSQRDSKHPKQRVFFSSCELRQFLIKKINIQKCI